MWQKRRRRSGPWGVKEAKFTCNFCLLDVPCSFSSSSLPFEFSWNSNFCDVTELNFNFCVKGPEKQFELRKFLIWAAIIFILPLLSLYEAQPIRNGRSHGQTLLYIGTLTIASLMEAWIYSIMEYLLVTAYEMHRKQSYDFAFIQIVWPLVFNANI